MTVLTEPNHTGEFIVTEANGYRSRAEGVLESGNDLAAGTVVQLDSVSGEYEPVVHEQDLPVAILYSATDATDAAKNAVFFVRDCEVASERLTYPDGYTPAQIADINALLLAQGIKVV